MWAAVPHVMSPEVGSWGHGVMGCIYQQKPTRVGPSPLYRRPFRSFLSPASEETAGNLLWLLTLGRSMDKDRKTLWEPKVGRGSVRSAQYFGW